MQSSGIIPVFSKCSVCSKHTFTHSLAAEWVIWVRNRLLHRSMTQCCASSACDILRVNGHLATVLSSSLTT